MKSNWLAGIGALTLLSAACGDDANSGITASGSGTATDATTDDTPATQGSNSNSNSESSPTTSAGSDSEGQTTTTGTPDPVTTTEDSTTTGSPGTTTTTTTDPGTTTEDSTSTTEGVDTETSTTDAPDTTGGDTGDEDECPLAQMHLPCDADSDDVLHAIGLNCTSLGGDWQDNINATAITDWSFQAAPAIGNRRAWQVAKSYGTYIDPNTNAPFWSSREGDKVLLISSGLLPAPNGQGAVIVPNGDVYNDVGGGQWDSDTMPPPMSPQHGSPDPMGFTNCDGVNDCSNTLLDQWTLGDADPNDKMWFSFKLTAPAKANGHLADANGFTFDFAYFSAEFPEWVGDTFNDIFVVWQASEDYTGNVVFINGQPLTVTALWPIDFEGECDFFDPNCQGADPHLQGTGHLNDGGATGWYQANGGVKPGETFTLAFSIFDMGDSDYDTTAIIDNWKWDCEGCIPNEVDSCEIIPQ